MDGIEILSEEVVYVTEFSFTAFILPVIICAIIGGVWLLVDSGFEFGDTILGIIVGGVVGVILGAFICLGTAKTTDEILYIEYKVTVSDEVNFNEFSEEYRIIDQEGKIYTVRKK